jgi:hypothetical protein
MLFTYICTAPILLLAFSSTFELEKAFTANQALHLLGIGLSGDNVDSSSSSQLYPVKLFNIE